MVIVGVGSILSTTEDYVKLGDDSKSEEQEFEFITKDKTYLLRWSTGEIVEDVNAALMASSGV